MLKQYKIFFLFQTLSILYHSLCGTPPFSGVNPIDILKKHLVETPQKPTYHNPFIPQKLVAILKKAMDKAPDNRYQSAEEFSQDLQRAQRDLGEFDQGKAQGFNLRRWFNKILGWFSGRATHS